MKRCLYCNINVGGNSTNCPLCNSKLRGEGERGFFPDLVDLKRRSFFYKIQLFALWSAIVILLSLEYIFDIIMIPGKHLSLIIALWLLVIEYEISRIFKKNVSISRMATMLSFFVSALIMTTSAYFGFFTLGFNYIVPIILIGTMIANFIFSLRDRYQGSMVYLLSNVVVGIIPYLVLMWMDGRVPLFWSISLIVSVLFFIGAIVFKGRLVLVEIQKRLNV